MDVDCDVDQDLMMKFSSLGTTDREVLVNELQRVLDYQLNQAGCAFFLDMANWYDSSDCFDTKQLYPLTITPSIMTEILLTRL